MVCAYIYHNFLSSQLKTVHGGHSDVKISRQNVVYLVDKVGRRVACLSRNRTTRRTIVDGIGGMGRLPIRIQTAQQPVARCVVTVWTGF
ncbi:Uncharacterized protein TCM_003743 [Theobroma cacao]|uniref:Uncharacterized protein n=1 Tax=Theobroma cacao TaxID=3641 RepID=A0A061DW63_THECC|nr:Uncharacterized protein TCM_003743 [Theobroma cacao]